MIRKFNYTGRKKIPVNAINIRTFKSSGLHYFIANVDLRKYGFPADAKIYLEAYYNTNYQRFYYGTVGAPETPINTSLETLPADDNILFRIVVVDENESKGKILGKANGIKPENNLNGGAKESILPVRYDDLNYQIWKIEFDNGHPGPVLVFNNEANFPGIRTKVNSDPSFISLVYPAAIRFILNKMVEENLFDKDSGDWYVSWLNFFENVLGVFSTPQNNESANLNDWVEEVISSFCQKYKVINRLIS